jgi:hypothetical protein
MKPKVNYDTFPSSDMTYLKLAKIPIKEKILFNPIWDPIIPKFCLTHKPNVGNLFSFFPTIEINNIPLNFN